MGVENTNDVDSIYIDAHYFGSTQSVTPFNFSVLNQLTWVLLGPTYQTLDSDELPTYINLPAWTQDGRAGLEILGASVNDVGGPLSLDLQGVVDSINPAPEPATMLLLGSGLIGFAGFRRKKFKK